MRAVDLEIGFDFYYLSGAGPSGPTALSKRNTVRTR